MVLPVTRGSNEGGRFDGGGKIDYKQAEHGRAVHCDAAASGPVQGASAREGTRVPLRWWNQKGIDWETAKARGEEEGEEPASISGLGSSTEGEEKRHEGREEEESRASGSSRAEWSGASADEWEGS